MGNVIVLLLMVQITLVKILHHQPIKTGAILHHQEITHHQVIQHHQGLHHLAILLLHGLPHRVIQHLQGQVVVVQVVQDHRVVVVVAEENNYLNTLNIYQNYEEAHIFTFSYAFDNQPVIVAKCFRCITVFEDLLWWNRPLPGNG